MAHDPTRSQSVPEREAGDWHAADPSAPTAADVARANTDEKEAAAQDVADAAAEPVDPYAEFRVAEDGF